MLYQESTPVVTTTSSSTRVTPLYRGTQVVWYILTIVEALLAFRFVLRALGANSAAGFSSFIYSITYPFAAPFISVFQTSRAAGSVVEWSTLLAMFVYWLIAWAIIKLLVMSKPVSTSEAKEKLNEQDVT